MACARYALGVGREIERLYVDTGKVKEEHKYFAFQGPASELAAQTAECAGEQGKFWEYNDALYRLRTDEGKEAFTTDRLKRLGQQVLLKSSAFDSCLDSGRYAQRVRDETEEGRRLGVNSTPTIQIGGQWLRGIPPLQTLQSAIEAELARHAASGHLGR